MRKINLLLLPFVILISVIVIALQAEPGGETELRAQNCAAQENANSNNVYDIACDGTYPAACGAGNDLLSCNDNNYYEEQLVSNYKYSGVRINTSNSSITNCESIEEVFLCWEWWSTGSIHDAEILVDADGGSSWGFVEGAIPPQYKDPGLECNNVTSLESWSCSNFFGASATGALARNWVRRDASPSKEIITDALYFNVSYTTTPPDTCGDLNSDKTLSNSVSSSGTCFIINASNIILDCAGHNINYSTAGTIGYGVYNPGNFDNVTIRNCKINEMSTSNVLKYAIYLNNSINGNIENNTISTIGSFSHGINLDESNSTTLNNNTITTTGSYGYGIELNGSSKNIVLENSIITSESSGTGISFAGSLNNVTRNSINTEGFSAYGVSVSGSNNILKENTISTINDFSDGIQLAGSLNSLTNNNVSTGGESSYGIYIEYSEYSILSGNSFNTNSSVGVAVVGLDAKNYNHTIGTDNLVEGLSVIYNYSLSNQVVYEDVDLGNYGQLICGWCTNVTYDNITMGSDGISLFANTNSTIKNSNITTNKGYGIFSFSTDALGTDRGDNNNIIDNIVYVDCLNSEQRLYGIFFSNVDSNNLTGNKVKVCGTGIYFESVDEGNTITENTIESFPHAYYTEEMEGIYFWASEDNIISKNNISDMNYSIYLTDSNSNVFSENIMSNIPNIGIYLLSSTFNHTFLNNEFECKGQCSLINDTTGNSYINYLIYNNSWGEIRWTNSSDNDFLNDMDVTGDSLGLGKNLFIGNNTASLNTSAFGSNPPINSTANITLYGLTGSVNKVIKYEGYSTDQFYIQDYGTDCNGDTCHIISYSGGTLLFTTDYFSSFASDE